MLYVYIAGGIILLGIVIFLPRFLNSTAKLRMKINTYIRNNNIPQAIELQNKLISKSSNKAKEYIKLADIYIKGNRLSEAKLLYETMIKNKIFSQTIKEYNIKELIADLLYKEGKGIESFKLAFEIVNNHPSSFFANLILGKIYASQGKFEKAFKYLKKAVELEPDNLDANYYLGIAYLDSGDLSNGLVALDKAYEIDNMHLKTQYFLALACRQKGLKEKANMLFNKLRINNTADLPDIVTNIGLLAQEISKFDINSLEIKLKEVFSSADSDADTSSDNSAKSIEDLINTGSEVFHNTAIKIIKKMGFLIKKEIRDKLIDPNAELDLLVTAKKDEKQTPIFLQFTRGNSEIGKIPFADFLAKIKEYNAQAGVFITTSTFLQENIDKAKQEKMKLYLIDKDKLSRYI